MNPDCFIVSKDIILKAFFLLVFISVIHMIGCKTGNKRNDMIQSAKEVFKVDTLPTDSIDLLDFYDKEQGPANEYLIKELRSIQENFKKIDSIKKWTVIDKKDIEETAEGGEGDYYYLGDSLQKMVIWLYGETSKQLKVYYLLNEKPLFVFEKTFLYNRPIYYDTAAMKENGDTESFDTRKSKIIENRSYFKNGKLLHQVNSETNNTVLSKDHLVNEQKRIKSEFDEFIKVNRK